MGKTYVCSDIHAHADILREVLKKLQSDDMLYMIGDAVDKGPDGMEALKILRDDPRCEMLIGNHDLMMLQNLACEEHRDEIPAFLIVCFIAGQTGHLQRQHPLSCNMAWRRFIRL